MADPVTPAPVPYPKGYGNREPMPAAVLEPLGNRSEPIDKSLVCAGIPAGTAETLATTHEISGSGNRSGAVLAETRSNFDAVCGEVFARMAVGREVYGAFQPETDRRNLFFEAESELLDCIVYAYFAILKLRAARRSSEAVARPADTSSGVAKGIRGADFEP